MSRRSLPLLCLASTLLLPPLVHAQSAVPSFCGEPAGASEQAICADPELLAADRRLAPVYAAVLERTSRRERPGLRKEQEAWWAGVRDCAKLDDVHACIAGAYAYRTAELQAMHRLVGARGPFRFDCDDGSRIVVSYYATTPSSLVAVRGAERAFMLVQRSGSGARYAGPDGSFWEHQGSAAVSWRGGMPELRCKAL